MAYLRVILEDFEGNVVVFYGSANSTLSGYQNNYEKIRVVKNWIPGEQASIADEQKEFDSLWNNTNEFVKRDVYLKSPYALTRTVAANLKWERDEYNSWQKYQKDNAIKIFIL